MNDDASDGLRPRGVGLGGGLVPDTARADDEQAAEGGDDDGEDGDCDGGVLLLAAVHVGGDLVEARGGGWGRGRWERGWRW